jgi:hypothetical protein
VGDATGSALSTTLLATTMQRRKGSSKSGHVRVFLGMLLLLKKEK